MVEELWTLNSYQKMLSMDPIELTNYFQKLWLNTFSNSYNVLDTYNRFVEQYTRLVTNETLRAWGWTTNPPHVADPDKSDKRFNDKDWDQSIVFDSIKQFYLLAASTILKSTSEVRGLDEKMQRKMVFYVRLFLDAISPSNYTFTNPQVIRETIDSKGQNLLVGMQHLLRDIKDGHIKMTDTEAFKPGRNLAITPGKVIYRNRMIELIQYTPTTPTVSEIPLLFVSHWINKYYILDMQPYNSLIKFLVDNGITVFLISWKNPDASMEDITFDDYMNLGPLTALDIVKKVTGSSKVNTAGYCIGGTLLAMTLCYLHAKKDTTVNASTFFVSMFDFTEVGDTSVFIDGPQITYLEGQMKERGYLDSSEMANMFNILRDNDLIWSNVVNNYLLGKEPPAFDLLYWNADGTRMAPKAHSFYLRNTYLENNLIKPGKMVVNGVPIDLRTITQDVYSVGAEQDHLVPWKSAWQVNHLTGGKVRFVLASSGHIAGVVCPPAKGRGYWTNETAVKNADDWFGGAEVHKGSWWLDWLGWLKLRAGEQIVPPPTGSEEYQPLADAPGTYVLEK
jgi:polyhydroxyalkanoate synthase